MKRTLALGIFLWMFQSGCSSQGSEQAEETIRLSGYITNVEAGKDVYLSKVESNQVVPFDTIGVKEDGSFVTNLDIQEPGLYILDIYKKQRINLVLHDEDVIINADGVTNDGGYTIKGSTDTDFLNSAIAFRKDFSQQITILNNQYRKAKYDGDEELATQVQGKYASKQNEFTEGMKGLIWNMDTSVAAILSLQFIDQDSQFSFLDSLYRKFSGVDYESPIVYDFLKQVDNVRTLAVGNIAPEIELPNPEGDIVKLSSLRGKYVLIDFWAAWCKPCRVENPNVVRVYNEYKEDGFEILGVSLDRKRDDWLRAIEKDGLTWPHVSELKFWQSQVVKTYNVKGIPATYLIGPDGKIVAKNLRGPSLEAKLREIFS
ncbi:MAG: TlpA disulfide reductase family protein [Bacteroidota bacterium]